MKIKTNCSPFLFFILALFCWQKERATERLKVKGKSLVCDWTSEEIFPPLSPPFSLSTSCHSLFLGDFHPKKGEELLFFSSHLPHLYIISSDLSLIRTLPASSLPPKVFTYQRKRYLAVTNGKEIFFSPLATPLLHKKVSLPKLMVKGNTWIKDFSIQVQEEDMDVVTIEEEADIYSLRIYRYHHKNNREKFTLVAEERIPSSSFIKGEGMPPLLIAGGKVICRGDDNWERELPFPFRFAKAIYSADGKRIYLTTSDSSATCGKFYLLTSETGEILQEFPKGSPFSFGLNDFFLYDLNGDKKEEVILAYSGKEAGIMILADGKVIATKRFYSSFIYSRIITYILGVFKTDDGIEIMANLSFEKRGKYENWLYRLSPQLKVKDAIDIEDTVYAFAPLYPDGLLLVGQSFSVYKWE